MADIASGGNSQLQLKGAAQLAKGLRQAGADLKDLRDINEIGRASCRERVSSPV